MRTSVFERAKRANGSLEPLCTGHSFVHRADAHPLRAIVDDENNIAPYRFMSSTVRRSVSYAEYLPNLTNKRHCCDERGSLVIMLIKQARDYRSTVESASLIVSYSRPRRTLQRSTSSDTSGSIFTLLILTLHHVPSRLEVVKQDAAEAARQE